MNQAYQILGELFRCHANASIPNDQLRRAILVLMRYDCDVEILCAAQYLLVGQGGNPKLLQGIVGV